MSAERAAPSVAGYDVEAVRRDFPILGTTVHDKPLVYLDSAASAQKPRAVIEAESALYEGYYSNVHRGVHQLSVQSTEAYEAARGKARAFLGARESREVIFVRGTTEAINLVAQTFGRQSLKPGDEVLITGLEHHSNIVPWQSLCEQTGARLQVAPINEAGEVELPVFEKRLGPRTKLVALAHVSNALGTINPVKRMTALAHAVGAAVLIDGAQGAPHLALDMVDLDCDFYAFSGHKLYGPSGIGVLYGKAERLFEAGTPNIAGVIGLGAAIDYVTGLGLGAIAAHEDELLRYGTERLQAIPGLRIVGTAKKKAGVLSFVLDGIHPHDVGTVLDYEGIAVRTGHHCAQPVMDRYGLPATARASLACFNTRADLDALCRGIVKVQEMFR